MRTFAHPNFAEGEKCPLCNTNADREIMLIGIAETEKGNNMQAIQVHTNCISDSLRYFKNLNFIGTKTL